MTSSGQTAAIESDQETVRNGSAAVIQSTKNSHSGTLAFKAIVSMLFELYEPNPIGFFIVCVARYPWITI